MSTRRVWLTLCIALSLAACVLLVGAHRQAGAFSTYMLMAKQPVYRQHRRAPLIPAGTVNVNTADEETLCTLPGIGPKLAQAIIAEREANGPFDYPQDLLTVKGIGAKKMAKIYDLLAFSRTGAQ